METIKSIGASHGFGLGDLSIYTKEIDFEAKVVNSFPKAIEGITKELELKVEALKDENRKIEAEVLESYILILEDPEINSNLSTNSTVEEVITIFEDNAKQIESLDDEYFGQRAEDIRSLCKDVIISMQDVSSSFELKEGTILAAEDLTPTDTSNMNLNNIEGLIIKYGGPTSHAVIVAKNLGIPCVIGLNDNFTRLKNGQKVLINGQNGEVVIDPDTDRIDELQKKIKEQEALVSSFTKKKLEDSDLDLRVNIGSNEEINQFNSEVLESIGLFRSEFIFLDSKEPPSLDQQISVNNQLSKKFSGTVIYRLLDVGGDKQVEYLNINKEENPFLGVRGIRLIESNENVFRSQLESIFKSDLYSRVKVMLPMVSTIEDLYTTRILIKEIAEKEGKEPLPMGVMIETPSAALIAEKLADNVDFFSIGSNDLTQLTLGLDRDSSLVADSFDERDQSVKKLLQLAIQACKKEDKYIGICGQGPSDYPDFAKWLVNLGIESISLNPDAVIKTWIEISQ